ncbi:MAG: type II secretion system F family protein [Planctomycetes bacterium]|nr:type II secretion system F family protein [Planctomycetota bacterium]
MNPSWLPAFYSVCGALIAVLLVRIWFKNRAAKQPRVTPSPRPATRQTTPAPLVPVPPVVAVPPVITTAASQVVPQAAPVVVPPPIPVTAVAANDIPEPYVTSASSTILRSSGVPSWENRTLLEHRGVLSRPQADAMPRVLAAEIPGADDSDRTFGTMLNPALAALLPDTPERQEEARRELNAAGYYNPHALENLAAIRYALMMLSVLVFGGLLLIVPTRLEPLAIAGLVIGPILGWALPMLRVRSKAAERTQEIGKAMPDLLDMLNMCVSQGLTVPDALKRILRDFRGVYPALSQELSIVLEQARINDLHTALEAFGRRINLPEVNSFTSLLIQTERMGTSVTQALTTYSDTMRESLRQRADEKGNRATFRLLFPTVMCLMPAVYLFLLGPAVNELSKFFNEGGRNTIDAGETAIQRLNTQRGVNR